MTQEKYVEYIRQGNEARQTLQQEWLTDPMAAQAASWQTPTAPTNETETMRGLSQMPWAWVPAEMNTNPTGVN
jgi:hypothetical protein